ncbi:MAG: BadF/BadG/BcrA/BcrD ATPase family protein [Lacisediminihabitans sp.]
MSEAAMTEYVLAIDGGGTKTDVIALSTDGRMLARRRGATSSPQAIGLDRAVAELDSLAEPILAELGADGLVQTNIYLSGLDTPEEIAALDAAIADRAWLRGSPVLENDLFALLRTGTGSPNAAAVVIGTGINAAAVREDGETARFLALGTISGDRGGGSALGSDALWHAARSEDGRGPKTILEFMVPAVFGLNTVREVSLGLHFGRLNDRLVRTLSYTILEAARQGDAVAGDVVDVEAAEAAVMASVLLERLELQNAVVPVVLGGGVIASGDERLIGGIRRGLAERAPHAVIQPTSAPPIIGAGLLALETIGLRDEVTLERAGAEILSAASLATVR